MEKQLIIQQAIEAHMTATGVSQNVLATQVGVSPATLSNIRGGKWQNIAAPMWNKVASFFDIREDWQLFETPNFQRVSKLCHDAKQHHRMLAIAGYTGSGKTTALREVAKKNPDTYYLLCTTVMGRRDLVRGILRSMGLDDAGNIASGIATICERLNEVSNPLLILDDVAKLTDTNLRLIQVIYDQTEFRTGIVLAGTEYLKKYIDRMAGKDKQGFRELKRRIQYWQSMARPSKAVVTQIAAHHGVDDNNAIGYLMRTADDYGTLRNLLVNAKQAVALKPELKVSAELLAGLHVGDSHYQNV